MSPRIAAVFYAFLILSLFWLDREKKVRTSLALWLPVFWLSLAGSRSVGQWLLWGEPVSFSQSVQEGSPTDRTVYMSAVFIGLIVLITRHKRVWKLLRANWPVVLFFSYCVMSLLWSDYPDVAFKRWTKALGDFIMVLIVWSDDQPLAAVKRLLARVGFLLIPLSVLFIKYYPEIGKGYGEWDYEAHYIGVTTNKNTLGVICLFFGLAAVWRLISVYRDKGQENRGRQLAAQGIFLAMVLWLFSMANSMTSLSCFVMASGLLVATNIRAISKKPTIVRLLLFLVIVVPFSTLFLGVGAGVAQGALSRDVSTLTDRTGIWKLVLSEATKRPFLGAGFESFWIGPRLGKIYSVFAWRPNQSHNGYIETFANLGWLGVILLAIVIVAGYRRVMSAYELASPIGPLVLAYFAVGVIYNFTEAAFFRMMAPAWIFFLLAITCNLNLKSPRTLSSTKKFLKRSHGTVQPVARIALSEEIA